LNQAYSLRKLLLSDSGISLLLHTLKCLVALAINWIVLVQFPSVDYVTWAVSSSILVVATASDLGIGQFATTQFIHTAPARWPAIARESIAALTPLAIVAIVFVYFALGSQPVAYKAAMAIFIGLRVLSIPFGAVLNAVNQFKLRKAIEVGVYLTSAVVISWVAYTGKPVLWALLTLNAAFMMGGFVTIQLAARYLDSHMLWSSWPPLANIGKVYRASVPFMVNNLTGLLTYGGFIWVSSFILTTDALARLSVLHTFILINAYQVYDVALRARQPDLVYPEHVSRMRKLNAVVMVSCPLLALLFGPAVLSFFTQSLVFTLAEILLFSIFLAIELGFLLIQSVAQVRPSLTHFLSRYSLIKLACQSLAIGVFWLTLPSPAGSLVAYLALLCGFSFLGYAGCRIHLGSTMRLSGA
jgi:hypothetical protein